VHLSEMQGEWRLKFHFKFKLTEPLRNFEKGVQVPLSFLIC
jgi:hypothetical protein